MEQEPGIQQIANTYERGLLVPKAKPSHQYILCPIGLVGSGKTTVCKPLAEKLSLVRISGDEIRKILKEKGYGYDTTQEIATIVTEKYLTQGYSICSDNDCVTEKTQKILEELKKKYGLKLVWIHINPPENFILTNLKLRHLKPNWLGTAEQMVENYYARKPLHEHLNFPFVYTFDTSKDNLSNQITEAIEVIKNDTKN